MSNRCIHWFRKGLRLHDNPALLTSLESSSVLYPVFILDPWFVKNGRVGVNRWRFLLEALTDLDHRLRDLGSRLFVLRGKPEEVLAKYFKTWNINLLSYEHDIEPYAKARDARVGEVADRHAVRVQSAVSHTLYDTRKVIAKNGGRPPLTYAKMLSLVSAMGPPVAAAAAPTQQHFKRCITPQVVADSGEDVDGDFEVPSLDDLGLDPKELGPRLYPGGESEALRRMETALARKTWIATFQKPQTSPNSLEPSTTVLSPYLKFGCLSPRLMYHRLNDVLRPYKQHTKPPVSLTGQLLWREFFTTVGDGVANFDRMEGNSVCRQIPWDDNPELLQAWREARTGFPFIDAIMTQLRQEGWIHHLARHAAACFLTRGDLWQSWERGKEVFEELLLDADWALNAGNWMWLSASAFFHQYFRVYSPIAFGKKTDKDGVYIRKYIPQLAKFPAKYIYEPWTAPRSVQEAARCLIGTDYPRPVVDHDSARVKNLSRMAKAYKQSAADASDDAVPAKKSKK